MATIIKEGSLERAKPWFTRISHFCNKCGTEFMIDDPSEIKEVGYHHDAVECPFCHNMVDINFEVLTIRFYEKFPEEKDLLR